MVRKQVLKLEDMKGQKIIVSGTWPGRIVESLGAAAVTFAWGEVYSALGKKVADGVISNYDTLLSRKFAEVTKFATDVGMMTADFYVIMNKNKWNSLPQDIRTILEELTGDYLVDKIDEYNRASEIKAVERAKKEYGVQFHKLPPEELARWANTIKPVREDWVASLVGKGLPGRKLLVRFDELWVDYSK
jgi:TRAP-type C4-dicarboxylate transport system substrate-binding protein